MPLHDLTGVFGDRRLDWSGRPREVEERFRADLRAIRRGIYVQYFENDAADVYDKNRGWRKGGLGALVVHAGGASLKPGKFQHGLVARRYQDADHLHRRRRDAIGATYVNCLRFVFVLDLTNQSGDAAFVRRAEKLLKGRVDAYIAREDLLRRDTTRRGDWRRLNARRALRPMAAEMLAILRATAADLGMRPSLAVHRAMRR